MLMKLSQFYRLPALVVKKVDLRGWFCRHFETYLPYLVAHMFRANLPTYSLRVKGRLLSLEQPIVIGILNITPDSFYDGGKYQLHEAALRRAMQMLDAGAAIIDIGAMSSKPGAQISDPDREAAQVLDVVEAILKERPEAVLSIDTLHAKVADEALSAGASIINDISAGLFDAKMLQVVAKHQAPYVMMHMQGLPENMQDHPTYSDVVTEVLDFFIRRIQAALDAGIADIILDPGFGFGKTIEHNFSLLHRFKDFTFLDKPLLAGLSRKSMIWKTLGTSSEQALNGTTALNMAALLSGAHILRVHDVAEAMETIRLFERLKS
jgi:dihydropteroate synthase